MPVLIKTAEEGDLEDVLKLYAQLHPDEDYSNSGHYADTWLQIIKDPKISCLIAYAAGQAVSSCTVSVIPNITRNQRPYAVIENVVTDPAFRRQGYARNVIIKAVELTREQNCYKVMLLSSSEREDAHRFYEKIGFDGTSKKGYQMRLC